MLGTTLCLPDQRFVLNAFDCGGAAAAQNNRISSFCDDVTGLQIDKSPYFSCLVLSSTQHSQLPSPHRTGKPSKLPVMGVLRKACSPRACQDCAASQIHVEASP